MKSVSEGVPGLDHAIAQRVIKELAFNEAEADNRAAKGQYEWSARHTHVARVLRAIYDAALEEVKTNA